MLPSCQNLNVISYRSAYGASNRCAYRSEKNGTLPRMCQGFLITGCYTTQPIPKDVTQIRMLPNRDDTVAQLDVTQRYTIQQSWNTLFNRAETEAKYHITERS